MSILVPGVNPSVEAIKKLNRRNIVSLISARKIPERLKKMILDLNIPVKEVEKSYLEKLLPGVNHQGIALEIKEFPYVSEDKILKMSSLVFLDGLESPINLGAISRISAFFGVEGIIIPRRRATKVTPLAIKTSEGGIFWVGINRVGNPTHFLKVLKDEGFTLIGATLNKGEDPSVLRGFSGKFVLMLGGEDRGLRPIREKLADVLVTIRGSGNINSLNVSSAASIILYSLKGKFDNAKTCVLSEKSC